MLRQRSAGILTPAILFAIVGYNAAAQIVYVDDSAIFSEDGSTWCHAYRNLQDALSVARDSGGDIHEIRVAAGVYKPDQGADQTSDDRTATFQLVNGVSIKGGYAGCTAHNPDDRDTSIYESVLSGDLVGDDVGDRSDPSRRENSYHIVAGSGADSSAQLDGFVILSGRADGADPHQSGAGLFNDNGSPTLIDCTFAGCWAYLYGGGIYNTNHSNPTLIRCTFRHNSGDYGGGMANDNSSGPSVSDCTFAANTAGNHGGGVYNASDEPPSLANCQFVRNAAYYSGGGMYNTDGTAPILFNCLFSENTARNGAGICDISAASKLRNCTLADNTARLGGGGMYSDGPIPRFTNCIAWGNADSSGTGELAQIRRIDGTSPIVDHCCIQGWSGAWGGTGNIGDDPLFVPGPAGCSYLSHIQAGQAVDSPCIDAGAGTSAGAGLDTLTTRSSEGVDTDATDMGFHYPVTGRSLVMGDYDRNGVLDLADFSSWADCMTGPWTAGVPSCCLVLDFDSDRDIDTLDFASLQAVFTAP
ncbi:MAG: right-handed parallel beta-helix repeat-containing protein [Phycisphaerales bacterium]|nr:MAG: right-handed parallel beta-helix repeat-containing protein [Phycisphaerales bacterium]